MVGEPPRLVRDDLLRHHDRAERQRHAEPLAPVVEPLDVHVGLALGLRVPVALERPHERAARLQVERLDLEHAPAVQVHGALVRRAERAPPVDGPEQLARRELDDREAVAARRAQRDRAGRVVAGVARDIGAARPPPQRARRLEPLRRGRQGRPEPLVVVGRDRSLVRRAEHVRGVDLLVLGIEDRRLDGPVEELVGMAAEELVQRVLARDVDRQPAPAPPGPAPHLAQRRDRARERDADRRVERADVDAQLQRVRGDDAEQLAVDEPLLQLAPLLRRVARAVGRDPRRQLGAPALLQRELGELGHQLDGLARLHEDDRARALAHELGEQVGSLGERGAPRGELLVGDRRVPHGDRLLGAGRAVAVDHRDVVEPGQPLGQLARVGDRRARQQEARLGAVGRRDPAQPPQHVGDVRAEDAAVDVRLVDDDDGEVGEHVGPRAVVGQHAEVEHVRVREDHVRAAPDLAALLARRVAVVDRRPGALDAERVQRPCLVLRERLGRIEVERAGAGVAAQRVERRELEAERLAAGRARRDDRGPRPRGVQRLGLVRPELVHPAGAQRGRDVRVQLAGQRDGARGAPVLRRLHDEPLVLAPCGEQRVPGLDVADDGHPRLRLERAGQATAESGRSSSA